VAALPVVCCAVVSVEAVSVVPHVPVELCSPEQGVSADVVSVVPQPEVPIVVSPLVVCCAVVSVEVVSAPVVSESPLAQGVSAESVVPVEVVSVPVLVPQVSVPLVVSALVPCVAVSVPVVVLVVSVPCVAVVVSAPCVVDVVEPVEVEGDDAVVVSAEVVDVVVSVDGELAVVELCWVAESVVVLAVESVVLVYESPEDVAVWLVEEVETPVPVPAALRLRRALFWRMTECVLGATTLAEASARDPKASDSKARCAKILPRFMLQASSTAASSKWQGYQAQALGVDVCL
jgi:hypothetical protein